MLSTGRVAAALVEQVGGPASLPLFAEACSAVIRSFGGGYRPRIGLVVGVWVPVTSTVQRSARNCEHGLALRVDGWPVDPAPWMARHRDA